MTSIIYFHTVYPFAQKANIIQVFEMCRSLANHNTQVTLYLPFRKADTQNMETKYIELIGTKNTNLYIRRFPYIFNGKGMQYMAFIFLFYVYLKNVKSVFYIRNPFLFVFLNIIKRKIVFESHAPLCGGIKNKFFRSKIVKIVNKSKCILFVCISKNLFQYWQDYKMNSHKMIVAHDGVSLDLFDSKETSEYYKLKLNINNTKPLILYAGSLYVDRKINVIIDLAKKIPNAIFYIIGGSKREIDQLSYECQKLQLNNIFFIGYVPHSLIPDYLFAADILLMLWSKEVPTINYCSPLKLFEYMSAKRTIVGYDFITIREVLNNFEDAYLINPDSFSELVGCIENLLKNGDKLNVAANAFHKVKEYYTWDARSKKILSAFENIFRLS